MKKIKRKINKTNGEISEYNENGNCIYYKSSNGFEIWVEYDENNNLIHIKDSDGVKDWREYDENGNCIHTKNSNGFEKWYKYDENNNLIYSKDSNGDEEWYDNTGDIIDNNIFEYEYYEEDYDIIPSLYFLRTI